MQIKQELLDYVFGLLAVHQPATIDGTYDGLEGELTMTFVGDASNYAIEFIYDGVNVNEFREVLCQSAGRLVATHNTNMGIPSRQPFIDYVTE